MVGIERGIRHEAAELAIDGGQRCGAGNASDFAAQAGVCKFCHALDAALALAQGGGNLVQRAAALTAFAAFARDLPPVVDYENVQVVTGSGKPASAEAVGVAISNAATYGRRQWVVKRIAPDKLRATYNQGSYAASVDVEYSDKAYSIHYVGSSNLRAGSDEKGQRTIHPSYNKWVDEFQRGIKAELSKL
jgi:hypothetical protein